MMMGTGDEKMTNALGVELLKNAFAHVMEMSATIAQFQAEGSTSLDTLLERLERAVNDYRTNKDRMKAGGAFLGKQQLGGGGDRKPPKGGSGNLGQGQPFDGDCRWRKKHGHKEAECKQKIRDKEAGRPRPKAKTQPGGGGGGKKGFGKGKQPMWCSHCQTSTHNTANCWYKASGGKSWQGQKAGKGYAVQTQQWPRQQWWGQGQPWTQQ